MKKFIIFVLMSVIALTTFAQNDYIGSKFLDNWSVNVQSGIITPTTHDFFKKTSPVIAIGADKYINPWFGVGIDARTAISAPTGSNNPHTMFDAVNVSGLVKFNVLKMIDPVDWMYEPVVITGLGWGHDNCEHTSYNGGKYGKHSNYMTYTAGIENNIRLNNKFDITITPAVKWGDINNGKLNRTHGHLEITAGVRYKFGKGFKKHRCPKPITIYRDKIIEKSVVKEVITPIESTYVVQFAFDSDEITDEMARVMDDIPTNSIATVVAYASPEGKAEYNQALSERRAIAVKKYLESREIKVLCAEGAGAFAKESNRIAIITIRQ